MFRAPFDNNISSRIFETFNSFAYENSINFGTQGFFISGGGVCLIQMSSKVSIQFKLIKYLVC